MGETVIERMERINAKQRISDFMVKEKQPYEFKVSYATIRAREFAAECERRGLNYHVSVGGLDSITLFLFLKSIGIDAPGISVSYLEDSSIRKIHKQLGIEQLQSAVRYIDENGLVHRWTKPQIIQEFGFPVLSKEIAAKIETLANPTEKNKTVRHAIITGETGEYGGFRKNSRIKMSQKWLEKFGGYANEGEGTDYQIPPFKVSSKCCYYLKEKPCDDWAKEHNSAPYLGLMASEGGDALRACGLTAVITSANRQYAPHRLQFLIGRTCYSSRSTWTCQCLKFTEQLNAGRTAPCTPPRHSGQAVQCAALEYI